MGAATNQPPRSTAHVALRGAVIVLSSDADDTQSFAAAELQRFLYVLTTSVSPMSQGSLPPGDDLIVLGGPLAAQLTAPPQKQQLGNQGYELKALVHDSRHVLVINACTSIGLLYGVYALLEELGMGFYAGGETYPDLPAPATLEQGFHCVARPSFAVRGNMLHYNFLCGPTTWGLCDYQFYFDQLARMRCNLLLMHWYDKEPGAAHHVDGEYVTGGVTPNSLSRPWGATASLRTSEFTFGTARFFDEEIFSSPAGEDLPDLLTEIRRSEVMFSDATRYARLLGIRVAAGFEAPRGDPTDAAVQRSFRERVRQFLGRNPYLAYFALWEHESGGCVGMAPPAKGTPGADLLESRRQQFAYLGNEQRVWEAIRFGRFAEIALEVLDELNSDLPLVLVGWGGDRWMQFADYCLAYDQLLPDRVVFTCHDNIDASMGPNVSTPWGQLQPGRQRWAMPWVEGDIDDCQVRQPHVESLGRLAPDALAKGCQGFLTLQWRTRDVEEETGFAAQFAWDPTLTPETFYRRFATHNFGGRHAATMSAHVATLQRLGARWTGVRGTTECGAMRWTGWVPHFPFDIDGATADYLLPKLDDAVNALAEVPETADSEAAFHLVSERKQADGQCDMSRRGVRELQQIRPRLEALRGITDEDAVRQGLREVEEAVYALRPRLVAHGMTGQSYRAIDGFLIAIHHLQRNAGARQHGTALKRIREDLEALREAYLQAGQIHRLERLDYLAATMDFVMHHDRAAMLLADGELVEQKLSEAADADDPAHAAAVAAEAYAILVDAGMQQAVQAFTRKLTTRCDYGVLCTLNVKPLPLYWRTIANLAGHLPAAPPRELTARGKNGEVWLSWTPDRADGQYLYRREAGGHAWERVGDRMLQPDCSMFVDTPPAGAYVYAVTAVSSSGFESPRSHGASAVCGSQAPPPRIDACKPHGRLGSGDDLCVRVTVHSDRQIAGVQLRWRTAGARAWQTQHMLRRFRDSYHALVPAERLPNGVFEFYVLAADCEGRQGAWPRTAPNVAWTVVSV